MILVMLSGGLDSTAALYRVLSRDEAPVAVHFVVYKNDRYRWAAERRAVQTIVERLTRDIRPFSVTRSVQDWRALNRAFIDLPLIGFTAAMVVRTDKSIDRVMFGMGHADDLAVPGYEDRATLTRSVFAAALADVGRCPPIELLPPELTKADLMRLIGPDLYHLTWSCRMPVYQRGIPRRCHACQTCRAIDTAARDAGPAYQSVPDRKPYEPAV